MIAKEPETAKPQANTSQSAVYFVSQPKPTKGRAIESPTPTTTWTVPVKAAATRAVAPTKQKAAATCAVAPKKQKAAAKCVGAPTKQKAAVTYAVALKKEKAASLPFAGFSGGRACAIQGGAVQGERQVPPVQGGAEEGGAAAIERQSGREGGGAEEGGERQGEREEGGHKKHQEGRPLSETVRRLR